MFIIYINFSVNERQTVSKLINFMLCYPDNAVQYESTVLPKSIYSSYLSQSESSSLINNESSFPVYSENKNESNQNSAIWNLYKLSEFNLKASIEVECTTIFS